MQVDHQELLQRVGVIAIEDATLFTDFPVLVWLMAASLKQFKLRRDMFAWVLGVVRAMAKSPFRDRDFSFENDLDISKVYKELHNQDHQTLVFALLFRRDYKCMAGDKVLYSQET